MRRLSDAEYVWDDGNGRYLIGEDEHGMWCAPTRRRFSNGGRVWRRCVRVNVLRLLSSWLQRKIVFVEAVSDA